MEHIAEERQQLESIKNSESALLKSTIPTNGRVNIFDNFWPFSSKFTGTEDFRMRDNDFTGTFLSHLSLSLSVLIINPTRSDTWLCLINSIHLSQILKQRSVY